MGAVGDHRESQVMKRLLPGDEPAPPWKRPRPKDGPGMRLTQEYKAIAKARAEKAGRPYPNFIDNAAAARLQRAARSKKAFSD